MNILFMILPATILFCLLKEVCKRNLSEEASNLTAFSISMAIIPIAVVSGIEVRHPNGGIFYADDVLESYLILFIMVFLFFLLVKKIKSDQVLSCLFISRSGVFFEASIWKSSRVQHVIFWGSER